MNDIHSGIEAESLRSILTACLGILNGIAIFLWTEVYNYFSEVVVDWENHKFESEK